MFIQTESTPNPDALKFLPGRPVMTHGSLDSRRAEEAAASPLAARLWNIQGVAGVFLGPDFISVSKLAAANWANIRPEVQASIMDFFMSGQAVMGGAPQAANSDIPPEKLAQPHVREILAVIDEHIRPGVARDGGDVKFVEFDEGVLYLEMRGACANCPASQRTLKHGIEKILQRYIPEVKEVFAIS